MTTRSYVQGLKLERDELVEMLESLARRPSLKLDPERLRARTEDYRKRIAEADRLISMLELKLLREQQPR